MDGFQYIRCPFNPSTGSGRTDVFFRAFHKILWPFLVRVSSRSFRLRSGQALREVLFQKERFFTPTAPRLAMTEWLQEYVKCYRLWYFRKCFNMNLPQLLTCWDSLRKPVNLFAKYEKNTCFKLVIHQDFFSIVFSLHLLLNYISKLF
jgi:hypothetical protein